MGRTPNISPKKSKADKKRINLISAFVSYFKFINTICNDVSSYYSGLNFWIKQNHIIFKQNKTKQHGLHKKAPQANGF